MILQSHSQKYNHNLDEIKLKYFESNLIFLNKPKKKLINRKKIIMNNFFIFKAFVDVTIEIKTTCSLHKFINVLAVYTNFIAFYSVSF